MEKSNNPRIDLANSFVEQTNRNIFLTGKAGTGKTTFLHQLRMSSPKRMVVVAPTGVAAINAGGVTIHSFFQMAFGPILPDGGGYNSTIQKAKRYSREKINIIKSMDLLVIDEISMVRADLLDGVDMVLRRFRDRTKPFGGVQMLMIGDIHQLSPVVKDDEWAILRPYYDNLYFFSSRALKEAGYISIELQHIYRQQDKHFIELLEHIRRNTADYSVLQQLNNRCVDNHNIEREGCITLTTHNRQAEEINALELNKLHAAVHIFTAEVEGEFPEYSFPTKGELELKVGSQVMFVKNDSSPDKLYYNGKIGKVQEVREEHIFVLCPGENTPIPVETELWENIRYNVDQNSAEIKEHVIGSFRQYPLKLAWAITIHKSQGLTFERAIIDAQAAFAYGQVYVALSRCMTLEGLYLSSPIISDSIKTDNTVNSFSNEVETGTPDRSDLQIAKEQYELNLIRDLFNFDQLIRQTGYCRKIIQENSSALLGKPAEVFTSIIHALQTHLADVAFRFQSEINNFVAKNPDIEQNRQLKDRMAKAGSYFLEKLDEHLLHPLSEFKIETDNSAVKRKVKRAIETLSGEAQIKSAGFRVCNEGFSVSHYLDERAKSSLEKPKKSTVKKQKLPVLNDNDANPELFEELKKWRKDKADELGLSAYRIFHQKTLYGLAEYMPSSNAELEMINGIGKKKIVQFGDEIIEIINKFKELTS